MESLQKYFNCIPAAARMAAKRSVVSSLQGDKREGGVGYRDRLAPCAVFNSSVRPSVLMAYSEPLHAVVLA